MALADSEMAAHDTHLTPVRITWQHSVCLEIAQQMPLPLGLVCNRHGDTPFTISKYAKEARVLFVHDELGSLIDLSQ